MRKKEGKGIGLLRVKRSDWYDYPIVSQLTIVERPRRNSHSASWFSMTYLMISTVVVIFIFVRILFL